MTVGDFGQLPSVGHEVDRAADGDDGAASSRQALRGVPRRSGRVRCVDAAAGDRPLGRAQGVEGQYLRRVAADRLRPVRQQVEGDAGPVVQRAHCDRVEDPGRAGVARGRGGGVHGASAVGGHGAEVDHQGVGDPREGARFLDRLDHGRRRADRQHGVRGAVGDHEVGDAVHQRAALPQAVQGVGDGGGEA